MYLSRDGLSLTTPSGYVRFTKRSDGWYYYIPVNKEEDEYLKKFAKNTGMITRAGGDDDEKKESSADVEKSASKASAKSSSNLKKK